MRFTPILLATMLSACSFSFLKFDNEPVVKATYAAGATKESIIAAGGKPESEVNVPEISGTCVNYTLRKDGETMPFYVAFDKSGKPTHYSYVTCAEAKRLGVFKKGENK